MSIRAIDPAQGLDGDGFDEAVCVLGTVVEDVVTERAVPVDVRHPWPLIAKIHEIAPAEKRIADVALAETFSGDRPVEFRNNRMRAIGSVGVLCRAPQSG